MADSATPEPVNTGSPQYIRPTKRQARDINDIEGQLQDKLEEQPACIALYLELIQHYNSKDQLENVRQVFDKAHDQFPYFSPLWTMQLNYELERDEFAKVEAILAKALAGATENNDLSLWKTYLDYVRRKNNLITGGEDARRVVLKAFDVVAEKCGSLEPRSFTFWNEYLSFLEHWKPVSKWEEQQRIDLLRKLYKQMLVLPMDNLEKLWNRYTVWEQDVNSLTARKFIGELSASYMKARSIYQEWSNVTKGLKRSLPTKLTQVGPSNTNFMPQPGQYDTHQLDIWLKWVKWELDNKLDLAPDALQARIDYVYKQAIQYMVFAPEVWYNYAMHNQPKSFCIISTGLLANPSSPSLTFKLAEHHELNNDVNEVKRCFEDCINQLILEYHITKDDYPKNDETTRASQLYHHRQKLTFVYCIYMNSMKRLSGLSAARKVFRKCRKLEKLLSHEIYIENAYLEFHNNSDIKTACKVLELGLKYFSNDGEYVNKYLDFLVLVNQDAQIKSLFETSLEKLTDLDQLQSIYKKVINYESKFGNLNNVYSLETRLFEKFPQLEKIEVFSDRYQIQRQNFVKKLELTYLQHDDKREENINNNRGTKRSLEINSNGVSGTKRQKSESFVPEKIIELLKVLPKRQYFKTSVLDADRLADFLSDRVQIPQDT